MVNKQKILIVDDDNNIAELISLYLTKECFETMIVGDGESALSAVDSFSPNLILLDLMLPGIDGYQVCREVRSKSNIPIIMLSAKGEIFDKVLGLELGADDYMEKPFDSKELVARVKAVLRRYKTAQPLRSLPISNAWNIRISLSTRPTIRLSIWENRWKCRQRSWNCFISWPLLPTMSSPENSFWIRFGDMSILEIPVPLTCISSACGKKSRIMNPGGLQRSGASVISLK